MAGKLQRRAQLLEQIQDKQAEVDKIQAELDELKSMDPVEALAIELHDATCTADHTEGCGWHYETEKGKHKWDGHAHKRYLETAVKLNDSLEEYNITPEQFFNLLVIARGY